MSEAVIHQVVCLVSGRPMALGTGSWWAPGIVIFLALHGSFLCPLQGTCGLAQSPPVMGSGAKQQY